MGATSDKPEPVEPKSSWDGLTSTLIDRMRKDSTDQASRILVRRGKRRLRVLLHQALFQARNRIVPLTFAIATCLCTGVAFGVLIKSWPWSAPVGQDSYGDLTVGAATATVFSSVIFSAVTIPYQTASNVAPGYTSEVMTRKTPWITGLALVVLAVFLFSLSAGRPDSAATLAAGLLTSAGFSVTWLVSYQLIRSGDPLEVSLRQAAHIQRGFWISIKHMQKLDRLWLDRKDRTEANIYTIGKDQELQFLAGFLRHMRTGVTTAYVSGHPELAYSYWSAMVKTFSEYALKRNGQVGSYTGAIAVIIEALTQMVKEGVAKGGEYDRTAYHCLQRLSELIELDVSDPDYSQTRYALSNCLGDLLRITWDDDYSQVPAGVTKCYGDFLVRLAAIDAYDDSEAIIRELSKVTVQAYVANRVHIALTGCEALVGAIPGLVAIDEPYRGYLIGALLESMTPIAELRKAGSVRLNEPSAIVMPGITVGNPGIQRAINLSGHSVGGMLSLFQASSEWFEKIGASFAKFKPKRLHQDPISDLLAVNLCLLYRMIATGISKDWPAGAASSATNWLFTDDIAEPSKRLVFANTAELVWSSILAAGFGAHDAGVVREQAELLRPFIESAPTGPMVTNYGADFYRGVLIAIDVPEDQTEQLVSGFKKKHGTGDFDGLGRIPGFGRVPSVVRNRTEHHAAVPLAINAWALSEFPRFRSA